MGVGLGGYVAAIVGTLVVTAGQSRQDIGIGYGVLAILLSVVLLVTGLVLLGFRSARALGVGLLIAMAIGVLVGGGICVGFLAI